MKSNCGGGGGNFCCPVGVAAAAAASRNINESVQHPKQSRLEGAQKRKRKQGKANEKRKKARPGEGVSNVFAFVNFHQLSK